MVETEEKKDEDHTRDQRRIDKLLSFPEDVSMSRLLSHMPIVCICVCVCVGWTI